MPLQFVAIVDLDHTLRNSFWRDAMIPNNDWDAYHAAGSDDQPAHDVVAMINGLSQANWLIIGCTAIPDKFRGACMKWMMENNVQMDELLMRSDEDYRPAPEIKLALVKARFGERMKNEVTVVFDDRTDVVEAFVSEGITAVQVHGRH